MLQGCSTFSLAKYVARAGTVLFCYRDTLMPCAVEIHKNVVYFWHKTKIHYRIDVEIDASNNGLMMNGWMHE